MVRFLAVFLFLLTGLFLLEMWEPVRVSVVFPFTIGLAHASTWLIGIFDADVVVRGNEMRHLGSHFAVLVEAGCNGVEAMLILAAGILAFPAPWKHKAAGLVLGVVVIQVVNLARIISLFYIGAWNTAVFDWAHLYLWPALIMLLALLYWLGWVALLPAVEEPLPARTDQGRTIRSPKREKKRRR